MLKLGSVLAVAVLGLAGCAEDTPTVTQQTGDSPAGPQTIAVTAVEYEFQGIPETLEAGETTFTFENAGEEDHEMSLALITGDQSVEELLELPEGKVNKFIQDAGHTFAQAGQSSEFTAELEAGRYGYVCFVESPDGPPHAFLGMTGEFTVA